MNRLSLENKRAIEKLANLRVFSKMEVMCLKTITDLYIDKSDICYKLNACKSQNY